MTLDSKVCVRIRLRSPGDQRLLREHEGGLWRVVGELGEEASAEEGGQQGGDQDVDEGEHDARRAVGIGVFSVSILLSMTEDMALPPQPVFFYLTFSSHPPQPVKHIFGTSSFAWS